VPDIDRPRIDLPRSRLAIVTFGLLLSAAISALDTSIVATAMPRIIAELSGLEYYAWVTTAYLVTSTTIIPISGKLGDLFGRKRFVQVGIVGFLISSAVCGVAASMPQLIIARAVQGVFGGIVTSSVFASFADLFLPVTRAKIQGLFASVFATASIAGPILGGILTDAFGWRYVFYVNIPVGLVASLIVAFTMPRIRTNSKLSQIDLRGALLLTAGLVPLLVALSETREAGWTSPVTLGLLAVAAVMLTAFVVAERSAAHPIMPLNLFRIPTFPVAVAVSFLAAFAMFGSNIFVPLVYQGLLGLSATQSGALLTPRMVAMVIASLTSGQIVTRVTHYRYVGAAGLVSMAFGLFLLSRVHVGSSEIDVILALIFIGIGFGSNQPIYQNAVQSAVPHEVVGVASSQVQFWRSLGQTVGVAVMGAVLTIRIGALVPIGEAAVVPTTPQERLALANGLDALFLVGAIVAAIAAVVSLQLREVPLRGRSRREPLAPIIAPEAASVGD
jgi:EmrB/QacA subfamily drug resistance transporter